MSSRRTTSVYERGSDTWTEITILTVPMFLAACIGFYVLLLLVTIASLPKNIREAWLGRRKWSQVFNNRDYWD